MKKGIFFLFFIGLISCKIQQPVVTAIPEIPKTKEILVSDVIANHYNNKLNYSSVFISSDVFFSDEKQTLEVSAEIKIKKDEQILISIRYLGITVAKLLITPQTVSYYEKMKGTYFEGDFQGLTQWLGTDLDFSKIQNMLLGEAFDNLELGKYFLSKNELGFELSDLGSGNTQKTFVLEKDKFQIQKQEINQPELNRMIQAIYTKPLVFTEGVLPTQISIQTLQEKGKTEIRLNYNSVEFNEPLSFPYKIPNGLKRVLIK